MGVVRVLVTGGAGRIGRWVVRELVAHQHAVTIYDRVPPSEQPAGVEYKLGDCDDLGGVYDVMRGHDAVIHLAAIPSNRHHPYPTVFRTNVVSTYNVGEAAGQPAVPADRRGTPETAPGRLQPDEAGRRGDPGGAAPPDGTAHDRDPAAAHAVRQPSRRGSGGARAPGPARAG